MGEKTVSSLARILSEHRHRSFFFNEIRRTLILNYYYLTVFRHTQEIPIESVLEISPSQVICISLRLPVGEKGGIEDNKARVWKATITAKLHEPDCESGMRYGAQTFASAAAFLA